MTIFCQIVNIWRILCAEMMGRAGARPTGKWKWELEADGRERAARRAVLFEGLSRSGLRGTDLARGDGGNVVVFAADGCARKAAEHGELAGVGQGVGDGALEKALNGGV